MTLTLGDYLKCQRLFAAVHRQLPGPHGGRHLVGRPGPVSCDFPAAAFVQFFTNHGILNVIDQPNWRVVKRRLAAVRGAADPALPRPGAPLDAGGEGAAPGGPGRGHPARAVSQNPLTRWSSPPQRPGPGHAGRPLRCGARAALGAIPYQKNDTVLHTDSRLLPVNPKARASWNCRIPRRSRRASP